jgi:hypothetical protein
MGSLKVHKSCIKVHSRFVQQALSAEATGDQTAPPLGHIIMMHMYQISEEKEIGFSNSIYMLVRNVHGRLSWNE